jgi:hypothetical protein
LKASRVFAGLARSRYAANALGNDGQSHINSFGWWIAGDVIDNSDLPTKGTASYAGDAIGNISRLNEGQWLTYVATGDMDMTWNFNNRSGVLHIKNFDGLNFNGNMNMPIGGSRFSGDLTGSNATSGSATGAFVNDGTHTGGANPPGVIGNFGARGNDYQASGVFGGVLDKK